MTLSSCRISGGGGVAAVLVLAPDIKPSLIRYSQYQLEWQDGRDIWAADSQQAHERSKSDSVRWYRCPHADAITRETALSFMSQPSSIISSVIAQSELQGFWKISSSRPSGL